MSKRRAFSYIRMSTESQLKGNSLDRQLALTREYAKEKGFELIEDLQDIGLSAHSGENISKGKLGKFLKAIEDGEIERDCVLLVESLDRLSRKTPMEAFTQFTDILKYGIEVHTIFDRQIYTKEGFESSPGLLFSSIGYMLRAYSESEEKSKRLRKAWTSKREKLGTKVLTSLCPAWLRPRKDKSGFDIIHDRAKTVKKIFELCTQENMGAYSITRYLNQNIQRYPRFTLERASKGKPSHQTGWQKSYVTKILNSTAVYGEFRPHELKNGKRRPTQQVVAGYFPMIVPEKEFLLAQSAMKRRLQHGGGRKGEVFNNMFTQLLNCGACGGSIHFFNKGKPPKGGKYLQCYNSSGKNKCKCVPWRYEEFEKSFFTFCGEVNFEDVFRKVNEKSRKARIIDEIAAQKEKTQRLNQQIETTLEVVLGLSPDAKKRLQEKIEYLSAQLSSGEVNLKNLEASLQELEHRNPKNSQEEILGFIRSRKDKGAHKDDALVRRRIHKAISQVIEKIELFNLGTDFFPWEASESLSVRLRNALHKLGYRTEEQINALFSNNNAKTLFDKMERFFVVHFVNGEQKIVHPIIRHERKYHDKGLSRLAASAKRVSLSPAKRD